MTAMRALLEGLIDYAGLFPPASLDMRTAVNNYAAYRASDEAWMLGRFIVPAQRLDEFAAAFSEACCDEQSSPWLLSVISTGDAEEDARHMRLFSEGAAFLDAVEFKAADAADVEKQLGSMPPGMTAYAEFPPQKAGEFLPVLKRTGARAKIRTGGVTADVVPAVRKVADFLAACAKADVPFKATAGLHHPLRSMQKLTYEEQGPTAVMHGFINVFAAATVAYCGASIEEVVEVLDEQSPAAFGWKADGLQWRDRFLSEEQIIKTREKFAVGFGSCSFSEPVNDLKALGWL